MVLFVGVTLWSIAFAFARKVVMPARKPLEPLQVLAVDRKRTPHTVTLSREEDADLPGEYSFVANHETVHTRVGAIVSRTPTTVEREILSDLRRPVRVGDRGRITGWWFDGPDDFGDPVTHVRVPSEVGELPAWFIRPAGTSEAHIAIHVHGRGARREEVLRGVVPVGEAGWSSLIVTYRNDPEAPRNDTGRYGFGVSESRDIEAAIAYAIGRGAQSILLVGWSMGGTAVLRAAECSEHRAHIRGIILESPALDWPEILLHQARRAKLPFGVAQLGTRIMKRGRRFLGLEESFDVATLTAERCAQALRVPTLVHASDEDTFVPNGGALRFAELRGDLVTLRNVSRGEHVKLWNVDRLGWERATRSFAQHVLAPSDL